MPQAAIITLVRLQAGASILGLVLGALSRRITRIEGAAGLTLRGAAGGALEALVIHDI